MSDYTLPTVTRGNLPGDRQPYYTTLDGNSQTYYSGLDASVLFGDVFLGQLVSLEYQVQEMVMPLFAYGDYTMRRAVHGMRVVRGSFTVMFQQVHLMYQMLDYLKNGPQSPAAPVTPTPPTFTFEPQSLMSILSMDPAATFGLVGTQDPSKLLNGLAALSTQVKTKAGVDTHKLRKDQLAQVQQAKSAQWSQKESQAPGDLGLLSTLQGRLSSLYSRYDTAPDGFDIHIELGRPPESAAKWAQSGLPMPLSYAQAAAGSAQAFQSRDGSARVDRALQASPAYTTRKIVSVHLNGMSQSLDDSGRPVLESYGFIAADLI